MVQACGQAAVAVVLPGSCPAVEVKDVQCAKEEETQSRYKW